MKAPILFYHAFLPDDQPAQLALALVKHPANGQDISVKQNEDHFLISGPVLIPHQALLRQGDDGIPYYIKFTPASIAGIIDQFNEAPTFNLGHTGHGIKPAAIIDSGYHHATTQHPEGAWIVTFQIRPDVVTAYTDHSITIRVEEKEFTIEGFSLEGVFRLELEELIPAIDLGVLGKWIKTLKRQVGFSKQPITLKLKAVDAEISPLTTRQQLEDANLWNMALQWLIQGLIGKGIEMAGHAAWDRWSKQQVKAQNRQVNQTKPDADKSQPVMVKPSIAEQLSAIDQNLPDPEPLQTMRAELLSLQNQLQLARQEIDQLKLLIKGWLESPAITVEPHQKNDTNQSDPVSPADAFFERLQRLKRMDHQY